MSHVIGVGTARSGTALNAIDQGRIALAFISQKHGQFTYFSMQLGDPDWSEKDVLDFGGNVGNVLRDPNSTIDAKRYWCIDVSKEAIESGRRAFPESHWIAYDRRCFFFNPVGIPGLPLPRIAQTFDYVVAYSVFTNTPRSEMLELVEELWLRLKPGGALAFTFIDPHHRPWSGEFQSDNLLWRLEREQELYPDLSIDIERIRRDSQDARWFMLVNGTDLYLECDDPPDYAAHEQRTCHVFHTVAYLKTLFPRAQILPPVNNEMQHCCIIRR
jgi:SAM-dependent methyltransferase